MYLGIRGSKIVRSQTNLINLIKYKIGEEI